MPGLAVIIAPAGTGGCEADLDRMVASMRHEPFYRVGTYSDAALGLYVGWVCHSGSYCDRLPLHSKDGNLVLFFYGEHRSGDDNRNGESSDARAVLRLFEKHGLDAMPLLNGWFHGVLVDRRQQQIAIFNDRYGMQRLHVFEDRPGTLFAAEAKALLTVRPQLRKLDPRGVGEFLSCGCVLENRSLFTNVHTIPAATVRLFRQGRQEKEYRYFTPAEWESQSSLPPAEFDAVLRDVLSRSVDRCLASDTPIGVSLTGGFDTRLIMSRLHSAGVTLPSYTFGGMYRECFDVKIARKVARICGCNHQVFELGQDFLDGFSALAEKTIRLSDGCLGATNAYELYLNQRAREVAMIRLTGSYGSEVMRGARAFKALSPAPSLIHPDFQEHIDVAIRTFDAASGGHPVSFSVFKQAPWYYYSRLAVEQSQVVIRTPFMDNDFVGLFYRRPSSSEDSRKLAQRQIAASSPVLAELPTDTGNCSPLRHQWTQFLFKADYCYKSGMPQWLERAHYLLGPFQPEKLLIGRHRFAHFRVWFRKQLAPYVREILLDRRTAGRPYFNHNVVERMLDQHIKGEYNYTDDIERILTMELTCRQFLDN
jgi:asparagine synthase (glutamine-hydrolysing)